MDIRLFDPRLVIARLQDQVSALKLVAGAAEFAAARPEARILPAAFVIEASNRPRDNGYASMAVSQENAVTFGVTLAAQNLRDPRGEHSGAEMTALRASVMTALLGWQADADYDLITYAGGQLLQLDNLVLWWQDNYVTRIIERSA